MVESADSSRPPDHVPREIVVDFDAYNPPGAEGDLHLAFRALQEAGLPDIVWSVRNGGHWLPLRGKLISAIFSDHKNFSNSLAILPKEMGEKHFGIPQSLDPPDHRPFRKPLNTLLGRKRVSGLEDEIRTLVASKVEEVRRDGGCEFTQDYADVLPVLVFLRLVDLPIEDRIKLQKLTRCIVRPSGAAMSIEEAVGQLHDYLLGPIQQRLGRDGDDMLSQMINSRVYGRQMTIDEAVNMAMLVLEGGLDTVSNLMAFSIRFLANSPLHRRELVENPNLIPAAVEELVRRFPVATTGRIAKSDVIYAGVQIKDGDPVLLATPLHGLDERENVAAMECDFKRSRPKHSTFGQGIHFCPGAHLARLEMRVTLEEWLARIPEFELATHNIRCRGGVVNGIEALPLRWDVSTTHRM